MFKIVLVLAITSLTLSLGSPSPAVLAPLVGPSVVTSASSQYFYRQHNAPVVAPVVSPVVAPLVARPIATPFVAGPVVRTPVAPQAAPRTPEGGVNPLAETFSPLKQGGIVRGASSAYVAAPAFNPVVAPYFANQVFL